jgi:hypothetical protein
MVRPVGLSSLRLAAQRAFPGRVRGELTRQPADYACCQHPIRRFGSRGPTRQVPPGHRLAVIGQHTHGDAAARRGTSVWEEAGSMEAMRLRGIGRGIRQERHAGASEQAPLNVPQMAATRIAPRGRNTTPTSDTGQDITEATKSRPKRVVCGLSDAGSRKVLMPNRTRTRPPMLTATPRRHAARGKGNRPRHQETEMWARPRCPPAWSALRQMALRRRAFRRRAVANGRHARSAMCCSG